MGGESTFGDEGAFRSEGGELVGESGCRPRGDEETTDRGGFVESVQIEGVLASGVQFLAVEGTAQQVVYSGSGYVAVYGELVDLLTDAVQLFDDTPVLALPLYLEGHVVEVLLQVACLVFLCFAPHLFLLHD